MSMIDQFQKLDDLIKKHTESEVTTILRGQLALTQEQVEAYQAASDKQDRTLSSQAEAIAELQEENKELVAANAALQEENKKLIATTVELRQENEKLITTRARLQARNEPLSIRTFDSLGPPTYEPD
jgi:hypothetical protein